MHCLSKSKISPVRNSTVGIASDVKNVKEKEGCERVRRGGTQRRNKAMGGCQAILSGPHLRSI